MNELIMPRRAFLSGMASLFAAPAIVKASNIMPVKLVHFDNGLSLTSMAHPVRAGGINLSELRELLMPGLRKIVDDMYTEHPGQWKSFFVSEEL